MELWNESEQRWYDDKALGCRPGSPAAPRIAAGRTRSTRRAPAHDAEERLRARSRLGPFQPYESWYIGTSEWTGGVLHFRELHDQQMTSWAAQLGRDYTPFHLSRCRSFPTRRPTVPGHPLVLGPVITADCRSAPAGRMADRSGRFALDHPASGGRVPVIVVVINGTGWGGGQGCSRRFGSPDGVGAVSK